MQSIFEDERRANGGLSPRPNGVWPGSALAALRAIESEPHFQHALALRDRNRPQTVIHKEWSRAA